MNTTIHQLLSQADELQARLLAFRPMDAETLKSLREYYRVGLTYSSNAIEGNSLTESETKVVVEDGLTVDGKPLREIYEATGHARAYDYMRQLATNLPLSEEIICQLHRLFYQQIDDAKAGVYRTVPVFISGSRYPVAKTDKIADEMAKLVDWYNKNEQKLHPILLATELHKRFVFIHPFIDGNGRVARLLMNFSLIRNEYNIALIPAILRAEYIAVLEKAHTDVEPLQQFIIERVIETQLDLLRLLGGVNEVNGGVSGGVNDICTRILDLLKTEPHIRAPYIAERLQCSLRTIQRNLKTLTEQGKIAYKGAAKNGGYELMG